MTLFSLLLFGVFAHRIQSGLPLTRVLCYRILLISRTRYSDITITTGTCTCIHTYIHVHIRYY